MSQVETRMAELGVNLPEVAKPVAAYVPTVVTGNYVFTSGQLPFKDGKLPATGKVGETEGLVDPAEAQKLAKLSALNGLAAIKDAIGNLDKITKVVKVVVFVSSDPAFTGQPLVANGASEFIFEVFGEAGKHARSAVGVATLPLDAPVEVELIVEFAE